MPLIQDRATTLTFVDKALDEGPKLLEFFFVDELDYDAELLIGKKMTKELTLGALETAAQRLKELKSFDETSLEDLLRPLAEELNLKTGQLFGALRTAVTGRTATPPLFATMAVLGKARCLKRIEAALARLRKLAE